MKKERLLFWQPPCSLVPSAVQELLFLEHNIKKGLNFCNRLAALPMCGLLEDVWYRKVCVCECAV